ncbi:MAG: CocE/NonD family hydrolase [Oleiphilaceae bacterium]|nr:CocE/NonD family hydrolase [Oleiphilaceae bacterium]
MKTIDSFPVETMEEANVWIPMSDGIKLAARIWRPKNQKPVPAILEFIPYRKRFGTAMRDELMHPYLAGHGYACARVDLRGSGESEGVLEDEYLQQELDDGCDILQWLASQPWCTGDVGMVGISWGGFNGLQIAALQPPELKAVLAVCASDDRYADDVHHMGGCLLGDNISWASVMFAYNSLPPDPELVGDRWRDMWFERLRGSGLWLDTWLRHQSRDNYWRHGSIREDYSAVQCPVYAVSGWADGYSNAVFRIVENLEVPRKGLIGPWSHKYPHLGSPGPAIGFLQESLRWWDYWLKGEETGIMDEPRLRVWMQDSMPPAPSYVSRPGRWVAEDTWPSERIQNRTCPLMRYEIGEPEDQPPAFEHTVQSPLTLGLFAGKWCSYDAGPDMAYDQREEDGGALIFQGSLLKEGFEIMGAPYVDLEIAVDRPMAMVAVRLSDVAPDDKVTRVTFGLLNLNHRKDSAHPRALEPGEHYRVRVNMNAIAHSFPKNHRLRLSVSTSYWPLAWTPPEPVRLHVYTENSSLTLPEREPQESDKDLPAFAEPESARPPETTRLSAEHHNWLLHRDLATSKSALEVINDNGSYRLEPIDLNIQSSVVETYSCVADDFESPRAEVVSERALWRENWGIRTVTRTIVTCTRNAFHLHANIDAYEQSFDGEMEKRVYSNNWNTKIHRRSV